MSLQISNAINNYYNMKLGDRLTLIDKLEKLHEEEKYDAGYKYDYGEMLDAIRNIAYYTIKGQNFKNFYESLNSEQKKELQTQVCLTAKRVKGWIWFDVPKDYERLKDLYKEEINTSREYKELFIPNFEKIDEELSQCDGLFHTGLSSEKIISRFCRRFYSYAIDYDLDDYNFAEEDKKIIHERDYNPVVSEFNNAIKGSISILKENVNDSTKNIFDSLDPIQQMYTMFTILTITKGKLNDWIIERKELREKQKLEGKRGVVRINCKHGKITLMEDISKYEDKLTKRQQSKKRKAHTKMKEIRRVNSGYCY